MKAASDKICFDTENLCGTKLKSYVEFVFNTEDSQRQSGEKTVCHQSAHTFVEK